MGYGRLGSDVGYVVGSGRPEQQKQKANVSFLSTPKLHTEYNAALFNLNLYGNQERVHKRITTY